MYQKRDKTLNKVLQRIKNGKLPKNGLFKNVQGSNIEEELLMKFKKFVPNRLSERIALEYHNQYHSGVANTALMIKKRFWCRGIDKLVEKIVAQCTTCSQCKDPRISREMLQIPVEPEPRKCIAMDAGSMPVMPWGFNGFLLIVDLATIFISIAPFKRQTAPIIEDIVWKKWISVFGVPADLKSDQTKNIDGDVVKACVTGWE